MVRIEDAVPALPEWRDGRAPLPSGLDLLLTHACNLRCAYCPIWGEQARMPENLTMVDVPSAIAFFDSIRGFRPSIRLFGGEPFLHPEWPRIVAEASARGLPVTAVTNGMRLESDAERLVRSGLLAVGVSLDGSGSINDEARGAGTSARVMEGLDALRDAKCRLGSDTPFVEIYSTVHERTYAHLTTWARELGHRGIQKLRLQHLIWFSSKNLSASMDLLSRALPDPAFFASEEVSYRSDRMPEMDLELLRTELDALHSTPWPFELELRPELPTEELISYYRDPEFRRSSGRPCRLIEQYSFVDPRGRLYPCLSIEMGNVFETPFEEVWNGERYRAFRRLIRREQRLPLCERCPA